MTNRGTKGQLNVGALNVQGAAIVNQLQNVTIQWDTPGIEAANQIAVSATLYDGNGNAVTQPYALHWWLADNQYGQGLAVAPNVGVDVDANGYMVEYIANRAGIIMTEDNGGFSFELEHTTTGTWHVVVVLPDGRLSISSAITFA